MRRIDLDHLDNLPAFEPILARRALELDSNKRRADRAKPRSKKAWRRYRRDEWELSAMPEFILDKSDASQRFDALDEFTQGYIETMFFTDAQYEGEDECAGLTVADIAPAAWALINEECAQFQQEARTLLTLAYERDDYSPIQAGRDFWFTRNGHGVGFWDRQQLDAEGLGDKLSALCRWRSRDVYKGDDGLLHLA